ncbi:uncharacterized protein LOC129613406 [Condylostylus longicornis]|uniref:uncharacterized protein LOC129613406 n=1 Tax=Condylostylus longicornis TaxID=2530218 RepID=UPI00244E429B|nr:uncharacterized protein LOC129613406 [Condylostylus longicornis]
MSAAVFLQYDDNDNSSNSSFEELDQQNPNQNFELIATPLSTSPLSDLTESTEMLYPKVNETVFLKFLLNADDQIFLQYVRLSKPTFESLLKEYKKFRHVKDESLNVNLRLDLLIFLYYLGTQEVPLEHIVEKFDRTPAAVVQAIISVQELIIQKLLQNYITWPNSISEQKMLSKEFQRIYNCGPGVIGVLGSTSLIATESESDSIGSLIFQAVIDSNLIFRNIELSELGAIDEIEVLKNSSIYKNMCTNVDDISTGQYVCHQGNFIHFVSTASLPYVELEGENCNWLKETTYNDQHTAGIMTASKNFDNLIESVFETLKGRFPRLGNLEISWRGFQLRPSDMIKCAAVLSNFCKNRDDYL